MQLTSVVVVSEHNSTWVLFGQISKYNLLKFVSIFSGTLGVQPSPGGVSLNDWWDKTISHLPRRRGGRRVVQSSTPCGVFRRRGRSMCFRTLPCSWQPSQPSSRRTSPRGHTRAPRIPVMGMYPSRDPFFPVSCPSIIKTPQKYLLMFSSALQGIVSVQQYKMF
jgi:hypothetical protein